LDFIEQAPVLRRQGVRFTGSARRRPPLAVDVSAIPVPVLLLLRFGGSTCRQGGQSDAEAGARDSNERVPARNGWGTQRRHESVVLD
jgi:hypothetical protein